MKQHSDTGGMRIKAVLGFTEAVGLVLFIAHDSSLHIPTQRKERNGTKSASRRMPHAVQPLPLHGPSGEPSSVSHYRMSNPYDLLQRCHECFELGGAVLHEEQAAEGEVEDGAVAGAGVLLQKREVVSLDQPQPTNLSHITGGNEAPQNRVLNSSRVWFV